MAGGSFEIADRIVSDCVVGVTSEWSTAVPTIEDTRLALLKEMHRRFCEGPITFVTADSSFAPDSSDRSNTFRRLNRLAPEDRSILLLLRFERLATYEVSQVTGLAMKEIAGRVSTAELAVLQDA
ncbi:MAG: hypothetical protein AAFZ05_06385 [Pseudomonadota bacterium]